MPEDDRAHEGGCQDDFADLVEGSRTPHIYCDGIGPVAIKDGMIHVTFWALQQRTDGTGFERIVVGRCTSRVENTRDSVALVGSALAEDMARVIRNRIL